MTQSKASVAVVVAAVVVGLALGIVATLLGAKITLVMLAGALPLPLILRDYRLGVMLLVMLLPMSTMLPTISGLNLLNFVTIAALGSFALKKVFGKAEWVPLPRVFIWGYFVPVTIAILVAFPHISEGARNYYTSPDALETYQPISYAVQRYAKPVFYYFSFAFLVANAMMDSEKPERWLLLMALSAIPPAAAVFYTVVTYPGSFADVAANREFLEPRGMHANRFGLLFAFAAGPLLFMLGKMTSRLANLFVAGCLAIVLVALMLTFSRGGVLAFIVTAIGYLVLAKRIKVIFITIAVGALGLMFAPDAVQERLTVGLRSGALADAGDIARDDLTAGRVAGWVKLAPEVLESPIIGRGLGSTQWSAAVAQGSYIATHPHNIYLEILMDMGIVGAAVFVCFWVWLIRRFKVAVAGDAAATPVGAFLQGSRFALFGLLVMAATTGNYMPSAAQTYLWFGCGVLIWRLYTMPVAVPVPAVRPMRSARVRQPKPRFTRQRWQDKVPR